MSGYPWRILIIIQEEYLFMKSALRIASLLLCLVMCIGAIACANNRTDNPNEQHTTASSNDIDDQTTPAESTFNDTSNPEVQLSLPKLDFKDAQVTTLYWEDVERAEFFSDSITGDNVNDAIHARNLAVEDQLSVKLNYIGTAGNVSNSTDYLKKVQNSYNAGEKIYNILASHSRTGAVVAAGGMSENLLDIDDSYLDTSKPWWPSTMVETSTIGKGMYFISGDISTNTLHFMYGVYYNMDMIEDRGLEDPTDLALNGTWTIDKMIAMTADIYQDLNSNSIVDYGDFFGLSTLFFHADSFYSAAGMKWIDKDADGYMKVSDDYASEKSINLAQKITEWFATGNCYTENNNGNVNKTFADGHSLFTQNRIYIADNHHTCGLNGASFKYGVVPVPKYDENQVSYYTTVGNPFTLYEVMKGSENQSMATAVLECLGYYGYQLTTPAIFEVNMKYKYSSVDKTAQCFDIIRSNIVFDLGRIFGARLNTMSELWSKACISGDGWASQAQTQTKMLNRMVINLNKSFD